MQFRFRVLATGFALLLGGSLGGAQQIGKYVPIPAGSEADHAMTEVNAAGDPAQRLALIDKFAGGAQGDMAMVADEMYVNYYIAQKLYDKAFEYGDKLFALDPGNFNNAMNMVRAAAEKGDGEKLASYGDKAAGILAAYKASAAPEGMDADKWAQQKANTLSSNQENIHFLEQTVYSGEYQTPDPGRRADELMRFARAFPDSQYAMPAMGVAASSYQQAQNTTKMLEVANTILTKEPNNMGMLLLVSDYYGEKGEQLDKAETYAQKAATLADSAQKPADVTDEQWKQQTALQKGLALSTLGQVNLQKKNNAGAVTNFQTAAPLLKSSDTSYARNQYRLAFAYLNLKKIPEAKAALTDAASVNSPYKSYALDKLKALPAVAPKAARKKTS